MCGHTLVRTLTFISALHWCLHLQHNRFTLASLPLTCAQVHGLLLLQRLYAVLSEPSFTVYA